MAGRKGKKLTDQLRQAINASGLTRYRIAKDIGVDESALGKFCNGKRGVSNDVLDRLGEYLNLQIVQRRKPTTKKR